MNGCNYNTVQQQQYELGLSRLKQRPPPNCSHMYKEEDMVDVRFKTCEHLGCMKGPSFNDIGSKGGKFCSEHKEGLHEGGCMKAHTHT